MNIKMTCGCGLVNYNLDDWTSHWKYGVVQNNGTFLGNHPKIRAIWYFLNTKIEIIP